jgi:putative sigma-54 modulation protein
MQIIIKGKQMEVTPQLRQRIERKVQRLARFINEVTVIEEQTRSTRDRYSVHLALAGSHHPVHSEVSALNASTALDLVLDKVVTQLGKQKDRQTTFKRHVAPRMKLSLSRSGQLAAVEEEQDESIPQVDIAVEDEENEAIWSRVMEIRRLPTYPMTDQEVIAQMEKNGASFFPFFNEETNSVNVMYKLEEGGYGLLVPAID